MSNCVPCKSQPSSSHTKEPITLKSKWFEFPEGYVKYKNVEERIEGVGEGQKGLTINNYLCDQLEGRLVKVTEIRLEKETIKIKDEYWVGEKLGRK